MTPEQTDKAAAYNNKELQKGDFTDDHVVRLVQFWQDGHDLSNDGRCGPLTQKSLDDIIEVDREKEIKISLENDDQFDNETGLWLSWDGPATNQPKTYSEAMLYFGNPESRFPFVSGKLSNAWYVTNIMQCHESLGNRLPGVPAKWWVKIHKVVEPYLREGLRRALLTSAYRIQRIEGFVFRHIRHDPKRLSTHSLGCAFDVDPVWNYAYRYSRGQKVPKAWTAEWNKRWPKSVDREFVQAMASCGFAWGFDWDEDGTTADHRWQRPLHFEWIAEMATPSPSRLQASYSEH
jgi:hypothetical protein